MSVKSLEPPDVQLILGAKVEIEVHIDVTSSLQDQKIMVLIANHMSLLDINAAFCGSTLHPSSS